VASLDEYQTAWCIPDKKDLFEGSFDDLWVSKHFALIALYFHMIGWHERQLKLEQKWEEDRLRRAEHKHLVQASRHAIALGWMNYDALQSIQGQ
jgi:hypothetical protein